MTATVITGIGELVTNDARRPRPPRHHHATPPSWSRARRSPGSAPPPRHPPPTSRSTRAVAPCSRASSTPTPTWSSPATAPRSSRPGWPGRRYAAGGIRTTVAATRAASDEQLTSHVAPAGAGDAPAGHHHGRDQERLRAHRPRRGPQPRGRAPVHRGDDLPRCPRRAATAPTPRSTSRWSPARCSRRARRTPAGSTRSASAGRSTPTRPEPCSPPAPRPGSADACTPTSSARDPAYGWRRSSAWSPSTTAPT